MEEKQRGCMLEFFLLSQGRWWECYPISGKNREVGLTGRTERLAEVQTLKTTPATLQFIAMTDQPVKGKKKAKSKETVKIKNNNKKKKNTEGLTFIWVHYPKS